MHKERLAEYGPNMMTPPKQIPGLLKYLIALGNLFNVLLIVSAVLSFILVAIDPVANLFSVRFMSYCFGFSIIRSLTPYAGLDGHHPAGGGTAECAH